MSSKDGINYELNNDFEEFKKFEKKEKQVFNRLSWAFFFLLLAIIFI